ncbi:MAG: WD40 repeat domain-containing protein [Myxococcota bacterium]
MSSREVTEAHYLHERSGLEPVLRPPVKSPTALKWVPGREELIVGTKDGELVSVDPVLGTRTIAEGLGEVAAIDIHQDRTRYALVSRDGRVLVGTLKGATLFDVRHGYAGGMEVLLADKHLLLVGDEPDTRSLTIVSLEDGSITGRVRVPARVCQSLNPEGRPLLCRSTDAGLVVIGLARGQAFPRDLESTAHRLRPAHHFILGFTPTGICVWGQEGGVPRSMRLPDLTAGDISKNGRYLGLGTRNGAVALAHVEKLEKRVRPDLVRAFGTPVNSVAFSDRGKWLATGAESLRIWSWED